MGFLSRGKQSSSKDRLKTERASRKVLGTESVTMGDDISIQGRGKDIDSADVLLAMGHEQATLFRRWVEPYLQCILKSFRLPAHVLPCLSMYCSMTSALTLP